MPKKNESITILAVSNLRKSIRIKWEQPNGATADTYNVNFHENPLPAFYKALDALKPHVCNLCELHARDADKLSIVGIVCKEHGENTSASIIARKTLKRGRRVSGVETPSLPMYPEEGNKSKDHLDEDQAAAIEKVVTEATRYVAGERAQGQIVFEEPTAQPETTDKTEQFPALTEAAGS